jgi:hypothetical protein
VKTTVDDQALATELLNHVTITPQGDIEFGAAAGVSVIDDLSVDRDPTFNYAFLTLGDESSPDDQVDVWTTSNPSAVLTSAVGATVHPTRVGGLDGWRILAVDPTERNMVMWMETPRRMVAVFGTSPIETIHEIAESLDIVTETAWNDAVGS